MKVFRDCHQYPPSGCLSRQLPSFCEPNREAFPAKQVCSDASLTTPPPTPNDSFTQSFLVYFGHLSFAKLDQLEAEGKERQHGGHRAAGDVVKMSARGRALEAGDTSELPAVLTSAEYSYRSAGEQSRWRGAAKSVVAEGGSRAASKSAATAVPSATSVKEAAASVTKDPRHCECRSYGISYYQVLGNPEFLDVHQNHTDCHCRAEDVGTQGPVKSR